MNITVDGRIWQFSDEYAPLLYAEGTEELCLTLNTELRENRFVYNVSVKNPTDRDITPKAVVLRLGIDSYMDSYPQWNDKLFPTTLRCEKTHFWGYFSAPSGAVVGIGCKQPVASWRHIYNIASYGDYGHRIYTSELCLLADGSLPERHPRISTVKAGEELKYQIVMFNCDGLSSYGEQLYETVGIPFLGLESCTVFGDRRPAVKAVGYGENQIEFCDDGACGEQKIKASNGSFCSEAIYYRRMPWSYYMKNAYRQALEKPQKASTHVESWLGLFSIVLACKKYPHEADAAKARKAFEELFGLMHYGDTKRPCVIPNRIQNTAYMLSLVTDYCESGIGDRQEMLEIGNILSDFLIERQGDDGAYYNRSFHYTCVAYIAKSILEFALCESGCDEGIYAQRAEKHYASVSRAISDLVERGDNIGTEGEATFEDGMISCSALQIAMFALTLPENERGRYIVAAEKLIAQHRCLEMNIIPDARMRGSTVRFWEAQYDVMRYQNFITAAHGWTAWKNYALYYLYLLTGKEDYLSELYDSMGTCMRLAHSDLNWSFCVDPSVTAETFVPDKIQPLCNDAYAYAEPKEQAYRGKTEVQSFGECYIPMISGWYRTQKSDPLTGGYPKHKLVMDGYKKDADNQGGCCDNDVHEHFKCLEETLLGKVFVNVYGDRVSVYGGEATIENGKIALNCYEETDTVYINSKTAVDISVNGKDYPSVKGFVKI